MMFSIVIPYYKKKEFIIRCLDAIFQQSNSNFEAILVDDGSNDGLDAFLKNSFSFFDDARLRVFTKENSGVSGARNFGIQKATGKYIAFLDADDYWHRDYLRFAAEIIQKEQDVSIIGFHYSRDVALLQKPKQLSYYVIANYFKIAAKNTLFFTSATIIERGFFTDNLFDTSINRGEDTDLWLKAVYFGNKAIYVNTTMVYYSDEDVNQLTKVKANLEKTLVGNINTTYVTLRNTSKDNYFDSFISKYVYFNLYPYYFDENNHQKAKKVLKQNRYFFLLLHLPYLMPLSVGKKIIAHPKANYCLRSYLKLVIRLMTR